MEQYSKRFAKYYDELKWLYCELYENQMEHFEALCEQLAFWYQNRDAELKKSDTLRAKNPSWYKENKILGMMLYVDAFAENLQGVQEKLDYIEECGVNYLHLMPLLDTPEGRSDGGYAVADFRKVKPNLGEMHDLEKLCKECHARDISVCLDFVMNHTSEDHEWAIKAKQGDIAYQNRYYFYDNYDIPSQYEKTVPQVFPTTAPGNFTWNPETGKYVMTTFYPYQWDLNYRNPVVLNEMIFNMLFLANKGISIIRIDAVPYIWKQIGTNCRNLPQVHNIVRIMRIVCEIVCPGVLLLGEVVMEPDKIVPYFGTTEKPECHMLYNVTTMASTWHTVATRDTRLLKRQMDIVNHLPKEYVFLNYLRCHDDIGWGLDYDYLSQFGMEEVQHKKYLNDFLTGVYPNSFARGELYNSDPTSGDARLCGTTASLCGIEKALFERSNEVACVHEQVANADCECPLSNNQAFLDDAIRYDITLHAYMLVQSGIPVIYSGDEVGQLNDYSYHENDAKKDDSRYLHRGQFQWNLAENRKNAESLQSKLFHGIKKLGNIRKEYSVFGMDADVRTIYTGDDAVLGVVRINQKEELVALFNFSEHEKEIEMAELQGVYKELLSERITESKKVCLKAFETMWFLKSK